MAALIPFGGSNAIACYGYWDCGDELQMQLPGLTHIFTAIGSGGTMAGLVKSLGASRVVGVDAGAVTDPGDKVVFLHSGGLPGFFGSLEALSFSQNG